MASQVSNHLDGDPWVEFGGNITFSCKNDHLFEDDPSQTEFYAKCLNNGSFVNHLPWNKCLNRKTRYVEINKQAYINQIVFYIPHFRYCPDPPPPPPGGSDNWKRSMMGTTPYLTTVNYTCGPGALLRMVRDRLARSITLV